MISSIEVTKPDYEYLSGISKYLKDVYITMLPDGVDDVIKYVDLAKQCNLNPIPHISVRNIQDYDHLNRILVHCDVEDILLIGGDRELGIGKLQFVSEIIESNIFDYNANIKRVGIAGFPESNDFSLEQIMYDKINALKDKGIEPYIVTQFCFDNEIIENWVLKVRGKTDCKIKIGIAGPMNILSLINLALKCGVGNSIRALNRTRSLITESMKSYDPKNLIDKLEKVVDNNTSLHLFAVGGRDKTSKWLIDRMCEKVDIERGKI